MDAVTMRRHRRVAPGKDGNAVTAFMRRRTFRFLCCNGSGPEEGHMLRSFTSRYRNSSLYSLLDPRQQDSRGRCCILISGMLSGIVVNLSTGIFATGFFSENGLNVVDIGILGMIPFFMSIVSVFSPCLLNRFVHRKVILCTSRFLYYTLYLLAVTMVPALHLPKQAAFLLFALLLCIANGINNLFAPGFSVWHVNFLPDQVRAPFFTLQQILNGALTSCALLISGKLSDNAAVGAQLSVLCNLRYVAFAIALLDVLILLVPKEYPIENAAKLKFFSSWRSVFRHRRFMLTLVVVCLWNIICNFATAFDVHLLQNIHMEYTFITAITASGILFQLVFSRFWNRVLRKYSWFKTLAFAVLLHVPTPAILGFVTPENYVWLYPAMRFLQIFLCVGIVIAFANMPFINLPVTDQTTCMSLYALAANFAAFLGQALGTWFVSATSEIQFQAFGATYNNIALLMCLQAFLLVVMGGYILRNHSALTIGPN